MFSFLFADCCVLLVIIVAGVFVSCNGYFGLLVGLLFGLVGT